MSDPSFHGPGFMVEPIGLASDGYQQPAIYIENEPPAPQGGPTPLDRARDSLERRYGVDLEFPGDLVVGADSDLVLTRNLEGLRASFARSIITAPAEIFWRTAYGVGATEFLNLRPTTENLNRLRNRIRSTLLEHPAVEELEGPEIGSASDGTLIEIQTRAIVEGQSQRIGLRIRGE